MLTSLILSTMAIAAPMSGLGSLDDTGCDSQWEDICFDEWESFGANDSLSVVEQDSEPGNYAIQMEAGTTMQHNGIGGTYAANSGDVEEFAVSVMPVGGSIQFAIQVRFRTSSGTVISTHNTVKTVSSSFDVVYAGHVAPTNAAYVDVKYVVGPGSTAGVSAIVGLDLQEGNGWKLFPKKNNKPPETGECPELTCTCTITCDNGQILVDRCDLGPAPTCVEDIFCGCVDAATSGNFPVVTSVP